VPDEEVRIAQVDIGLEANATRAKRLKKRNTSPVVVV
jgi:hypothetical protein